MMKLPPANWPPLTGESHDQADRGAGGPGRPNLRWQTPVFVLYPKNNKSLSFRFITMSTSDWGGSNNRQFAAAPDEFRA
ncbi:MAG: hypothetical protein ABW123_19955 [Cystobacter sp.]